MREKIKKIFKNKIFIFTLGVMLTWGMSVLAATYFPSGDVTYDNSSSGLESTNVQEAIDELYGVCQQGASQDADSIKDNVVTSGDGLYKDTYEDGRYFFKGRNPNNYIIFNHSEWRILSLEQDGTVKIIKEEKLGDNSGYNENYVLGSSASNWISKYYNSMTQTSKNQIQSHTFAVGTVVVDNDDLATQINDENSSKSTANIGMLTVSEYIRTNSNTSQCGTMQKTNEVYSCDNTTWIYYQIYGDQDSLWLANKSKSDSRDRFITNNGTISDFQENMNDGAVKPVVYLKSNLTFSGSGTREDPFEIK